MTRQRSLIILSIGFLALLFFQPARAQDSGPGYIDYLATQAALNTQATLTAYQQQQDANAAAAQASSAQAAAAQAQANAAYAAQQATIVAGQQQAALVSAQSTADAAALLATAQVQQTRTAIELSAQQTQTAANVRATATSWAIDVQRTKTAIEATRVAAEAKLRDDNTVATAVASSVQATQTAVAVQTITDAQRAEDDRRTQAIGSLVLSVIIILAGVLAILILAKFFRGLWRSRALNPVPAPTPSSMSPAAPSSAARSIVIYDQTDGQTRTLPDIETDDNPAHLDDLLQVLYGPRWN